MANIGAGLQGAAGGAAAGSALLPGVGTVLGGLLGGLGGLFGGGEDPQAKQAALQATATPEQVAAAQAQALASIQQQQNFVNALQAQNGLGNQSQVYGQLQDVVAGRGPNPAQAALANATGANVANQAALMASQRGSSANAGLMARQAAMQGANLQQQAAGQGAALQAQQSLNALGQAQNLATNQVNQQQTGLNALNSLNQGQQAAMMGGLNAGNANALSNTAQMNEFNRPLAAQGQANTQAIQGQLVSGLGTAAAQAPKGGYLGQLFQGKPNFDANMASGHGAKLAQGGKVMSIVEHLKMAKGGKVPVLLSPGEAYLSPEKAKAVAGKPSQVLAQAQRVPGKPQYPGNDYRNDVVPAKLSPGGIVIPNEVLQSKDPKKAAAAFVAAHLASKGRMK